MLIKTDFTKEKQKNLITYIGLLVFGFICAYSIFKNSTISASCYVETVEECYMWLRVDWLNMLIEELRNTGFYTGLHRLYDHNAAMYLYLSHIGVWLGLDAANTFYFIQTVLICICIGIYPALLYRCTGNIIVSCLSILFFRLFQPYSMFFLNDSYFIAGWAVFITAPVLYILYKEKFDIKKIKWIGFLLIIISICNIFRSNSALFIVVHITLIMLIKVIAPSLKLKNVKAASGAIIVCIISFITQSLFTVYVPSVYQNITNQPEPLPMKGPWHTLYIGLGWQENPSGLQYLDEYGYEGRWELLYNTDDGYYIGIESPQYIRQKKVDYFNELSQNFSFHLKSYIMKVLTAVKAVICDSIIFIPNLIHRRNKLGMKYSCIGLLVVFLAPIALIKGLKIYKRKLLGALIVSGWILTVNFCIGLLPGVIAYPYAPAYMYGSVASLDLIMLIACVIEAYILLCNKNSYSNRYADNKEAIKIH